MKKLLLVLTFALLATSCSSQTEDASDATEPVEETASTSEKDSESETTEKADTIETSDTSAEDTEPVISSEAVSDEVITVEAGTFESPTGNILCSMKEDYVDCYILEKNWEIKDADVPKDCEFDFGNALAIGLGETVPGFECYSDAYFLGYKGTTLEYGTAMTTGEFTCASSKEGVRCEDSTGEGFAMARDTYPLA